MSAAAAGAFPADGLLSEGEHIAGGPAPLIATALFAAYHSGYAVAGFMAFCAVVSLLATAGLKEYTNKDISAEYDAHLRPSVRS